MYCKCKKTDRFPGLFAKGCIYQWFWHNNAKTHVKVNRIWPALPKLMTLEDFLYTFDYWF